MRESFSAQPQAHRSVRQGENPRLFVLLIVHTHTHTKKSLLKLKLHRTSNFFSFSHRSPLLHFPASPPCPRLVFSPLPSLYSCHDKCQTQSVRRMPSPTPNPTLPPSSLLLLLLLLLLFGNQELAKWNVRWDEARLLRKHHVGASASDISVKVTEMFEGVVTGSQVPAVCAHLRELAPSHPPPLHHSPPPPPLVSTLPVVVFKLISLFSCYHLYRG